MSEPKVRISQRDGYQSKRLENDNKYIQGEIGNEDFDFNAPVIDTDENYIDEGTDPNDVAINHDNWESI